MKKFLVILIALIMVSGVMFAANPSGSGVANPINVIATNASKTILTLSQEALGSTTRINLAVDSEDGFLAGVKIGDWKLLSTYRGSLKLTYSTTVGFTSAQLTALGGDFVGYSVPYQLSIDSGVTYASSATLVTTPGEYTSFTRNANGAYLEAANTKDIYVKRADTTTEYTEAQDYTTTVTLTISTI